MKKLILILSLSMLLVGCDKNDENYLNYEDKNNFTVINEFDNYAIIDSGLQIYVIKDNENDYEYIVCKNYKGDVSITPRIKRPIILKEEDYNEKN